MQFMYLISGTALFLATIVACCSALADETIYALEKEGTRLRLSGDFV